MKTSLLGSTPPHTPNSYRAWKRLCLTLCVWYAWGCGGQPAPIQKQADSLSEDIQNPSQRAELGWLYYLSGQDERAQEVFTRSESHPIAQLGLAQMAADRLDTAAVSDALKQIPKTGRIGRIAARWLHEEDGDDAQGQWSHHGRLQPQDVFHALSLWKDIQLDLESQELRVEERSIQLDASQSETGHYASVIQAPQTPYLEISHGSAHGVWQSGRWIYRDYSSAGHARPMTIDPSQPLLVLWSGSTPPKVQYYADSGAHVHLDPLGPVVAGHPRSANWVRAYFDIWDVIQRRDGDLALVKLQEVPKTPAFAQLEARAQRLRPMMPPALASDLEIQSWQVARSLAPIRAQMRLAELYEATGETQASLKALEWLRSRTRLDARQINTWVRALDEAGRQAEAMRFLNQHEKDPCLHTDLRLRVFNTGNPEPLARRLLRCGDSELAIDFLMDLDTPDLALKLTHEADLTSERRAYHQARALLALGQAEAAKDALSGALDVDGQILLNDLKWADGISDVAAAEMRSFVTQNATDRQVLPLLATHPTWSPIASLEMDVEGLMNRAESDDETPRKTYRLLNHSVLLFSEKGAFVRSVHEVIRINSLNAAKEFGELGLPDEAIPMAIYTRKSDGRIRYAEESPDKDSLTIPELEPGDFLVAHYLQPMGTDSEQGHILSPHLFFGNFELDTQTQRVDALHPKGMKIQIDSRRMTVDQKRIKHDDTLVLNRTERTGLKGVPQEPRSPGAQHILPWIRFIHRHDPDTDLRTLQARYLELSAGSATFENWVSKQVGSAQGTERIERLLFAVRQQYRNSSALLETHVDRGLHDGIGHRSLVMSAALRILDIPHRLVLARVQGSRSKDAHWDPSQYGFALIDLGNQQWIDPSVDYGPVGYFPAALAGSEGVVLWPNRLEGSEWTTLPNPSPIPDSRRVTVSLRMTDSGQFQGQVQDILVGAEAGFVGHAFANTPEDKHALLANRMILNALPAAQVQTVRNPGPHSPYDALHLDYTIQGQLDSPNRLGCFPIRPGQRFAPLKKRQSPLVLGLPVNQVTTFKVLADQRVRFKEDPVYIHHGPHRFERIVRRTSTGFEVTCRLQVAGGIIGPNEYPAFRSWAHKVDAAEYLNIEFESKDEPSPSGVGPSARAHQDAPHL